MAYYDRGLTYYDPKDFDRAIAIPTPPSVSIRRTRSAYYNRGLAQYGRDDFDRAIADFSAAIEAERQDTQPLAMTGNGYGKRDYDKAIAADLDQAVKT